MREQREFIHFEERASDHPFIEKVWRCHSDRRDAFLSVSANSFEMAITRLGGERFLTLRGPETAATTLDCPAEGQWVCIRFRPGTFHATISARQSARSPGCNVTAGHCQVFLAKRFCHGVSQ